MLENLALVRLGVLVMSLAAFSLQDPEPRPWMQGQVEIACSRDGEPWSGDPSAKEWHACACQHTCDKDGKYEHSEETGGRRWDARCEARCSPSHCHCPTKCDT